jgi:hypothetical protein
VTSHRAAPKTGRRSPVVWVAAAATGAVLAAGCGGPSSSAKATQDVVAACASLAQMLQLDSQNSLSQQQLGQTLGAASTKAAAAAQLDPTKWDGFSHQVQELLKTMENGTVNHSEVLFIVHDCEAVTAPKS